MVFQYVSNNNKNNLETTILRIGEVIFYSFHKTNAICHTFGYPNFPNRSMFLLLPTLGPSACLPLQNSIFRCPDWFRRNNVLENYNRALAISYKVKIITNDFLKKISPINFFSWINLTFCKDSAASSMAWLKPFSPP